MEQYGTGQCGVGVLGRILWGRTVGWNTVKKDNVGRSDASRGEGQDWCEVWQRWLGKEEGCLHDTSVTHDLHSITGGDPPSG